MCTFSRALLLRCTACSEAVVQQYRVRGADFICEVVNGAADVLDRVTGLDELQATAGDACVDWDDDEDS